MVQIWSAATRGWGSAGSLQVHPPRIAPTPASSTCIAEGGPLPPGSKRKR